MPRRRLSRLALALCALAALLVAAAAEGALVRVNDVVLHADGSYQPRLLPRHRFAPIEFQGYVDVAAKSGGKPVPLQEAVVEFDRDGRLSAGGLPVCAPERVANLNVAAARRACRGAIVGSGRVEVLIGEAGGLAPLAASLTLFNGPAIGGEPSVVLQTRIAAQTFAIPVPIERRPGPFRYRATLAVPPIAAGLASITRIEIKVGRRFEAGGRERSYVSARCADGLLDTHGRFAFGDGTIVEGSVEKFCRAS